MCTILHMTKLDQFLHENNLRPGTIAKQAGYSRQHLLRLRHGEMEPTRGSMVAIAAACAHLLGRSVHPSDLFDLDPPASRGWVLLAEDNPGAAAGIMMLLEEQGFDVRHSFDMAGALQLGRDPPSLAVLDVALGRDDGRDLARQLRSMHPEIPILFVSGHLQNRAELGAFATDTNTSLLPKPFGSDSLAAAIEHLLNNRDQAER